MQFTCIMALISIFIAFVVFVKLHCTVLLRYAIELILSLSLTPSPLSSFSHFPLHSAQQYIAPFIHYTGFVGRNYIFRFIIYLL